MLDKKCRKIVKCCLKYYPDERTIQTTDLQKHLNFSKIEIRYCCQRLNELGFFDSFQTSIEDTVHCVNTIKHTNNADNTDDIRDTAIDVKIGCFINHYVITRIYVCQLL